MAETTWYRVERSYVKGSPWKIVPIQVVKQTAKMLIILETWGATKWQEAGSRERRELMNGDQFDSLEAANAAVQDRLSMAYDRAVDTCRDAENAIRNWKDVIA